MPNLFNIHLQWFSDPDTTVDTKKQQDANQKDIKDSDDSGANGKLNIELITKNYKENEEFKKEILKIVAPELDTRVSKGIKTGIENYDLKMKEQIEAQVEKLYQEKHPEETDDKREARQAKEKADRLEKMMLKEKRAKHLLAKMTELNINMNEELIDMIATFENNEGEQILNAFKKTNLDGFEAGKNSYISKHARTPQTGDTVTGEIKDIDLINKYMKGEISEEEYQRRASK